MRHNLRDNHLPKGLENWWEHEFSDVRKARARQAARKEIKEYVDITRHKEY